MNSIRLTHRLMGGGIGWLSVELPLLRLQPEKDLTLVEAVMNPIQDLRGVLGRVHHAVGAML
jgi:hypothetical protein